MNCEFCRKNVMIRTGLFLFLAMEAVLSIWTCREYAGHVYIYLMFTLVANLLLFSGFRKKAIFFDAFIGAFFWLGFWLKLSVRVSFSGGMFFEAVGQFDGSGAAFDRALLVATCGMSGFLLASLLREWFFNYPERIEETSLEGLSGFYRDHRKWVLPAFFILFMLVAASNVHLGIYQRGGVTKTFLPFGLNGVFKWLLLFGLASISALILRFEQEAGKETSYPVVILCLLEGFSSNVSMLSRGMILNSGALIYGLLRGRSHYSTGDGIRFFAKTTLLLGFLFAISVFGVNYLRSYVYLADVHPVSQGSAKATGRHLEEAKDMTTPLFVDRWVGMEGVMAVSSYSGLGMDLWKKAWKESYNENQTSFYDRTLIRSPYLDTDKSLHHYISLPGIVAFFFYPGSFVLLFFSTFALGMLAALLEVMTYLLGGRNIVLCSLLAEVVAFRYASFGYVPAQSYLLFGTIVLNLVLIHLANRILTGRTPGFGR